MLVSLEGCDILDVMWHGLFEKDQKLPHLAMDLIGSVARMRGYDPLETFDGVLIFTSLQAHYARGHKTQFLPAALEATVGYLSVGARYSRETELITNFSRGNPLFSKSIYRDFSLSTFFGAVIAYDALRKVDLSRRDVGLISKL